MTTLLFDPTRRAQLPGPIAEQAKIFAALSTEYGEHTTAGELAVLIETTLDFIYRIWVMEYVNIDAPDEATNRELFDALATRPFLGEKIGMAGTIRNLFLRENRTTVVEGLAALEFGQMGDSSVPVNRLLDFRNGFAHGSFTATQLAITTHRDLLENILESLPALCTQPVLTQTETGEILALRGELERVSVAPATPAPPLHPFIASNDGTSRLELFPMLRVGTTAGRWALMATDQSTTQSLESFFERETLRQYAERWQEERDGLLDHRREIGNRAWRGLTSEELGKLIAAIDKVQLVLVEARPGCGKAATLAALLDASALNLEGFADVSCIVIERDTPSHSAATFAGFVARSVERALSLPLRSIAQRKGKDASASKLVQLAATQLATARRRVLIGVEDVHLGTVPASSVQETVASVIRALAGTAVHFVMTSHPGSHVTPLAYDLRLELSAPYEPRRERLASWLHQVLEERPLHRRVINCLVNQSEPMSLFALCDALDAESEQRVFEPAVERALADMRAVIVSKRERAGGERLYSIFHPMVGQALAFEGENR